MDLEITHDISLFLRQTLIGANEYPQSKFLSQYKKNNEYTRKPHLSPFNAGYKGVLTAWKC